MNKPRLTVLTLAIAGALWALFITSPQAGRVAIVAFIVGLPYWLIAAAWLAKRKGGAVKHAR